MSGATEDPAASRGRQRQETIHVSISDVTGSRNLMVKGDCTIRQLKLSLSEHMGASVEQLQLIQSGRVLRDSELMSHLKGQNGWVDLCLALSVFACCYFTPPPSHTHLVFVVQGLNSCDLENLPGCFPALQLQMEGRLLADPEMLRRVLCSNFVQGSLTNASPDLIRQLILSNPQIQQLPHTNPEVKDMLNNTGVITQVLELIRNPDMLEDLMKNENSTSESQINQMHVLSSQSTDHLRKETTGAKSRSNSQSNTTAGMQSLLEEITSSPGLMESLLSGPYVSALIKCLSQNPDLAGQMLLSHPLLSGNPQLQHQMRMEIPRFLKQIQSPELLSAMMNPRALEALLQIEQGLQTLSAEAPALITAAAFGNSPTGNSPEAATVAEQQQQFVEQMLQALANTNGGRLLIFHIKMSQLRSFRHVQDASWTPSR
ncbi:ubiquilin-1-like [Pholidichthys leucotaenia]